LSQKPRPDTHTRLNFTTKFFPSLSEVDCVQEKKYKSTCSHAKQENDGKDPDELVFKQEP